eukprot:CAMPEP_0178722400 /NCGR_PEP_ID=MMETSP0699-20121125/24917_1 /TAXON_ID=265572 /ORGANISM="Extubocellulus spinifer, Strain CCMP396" /LENGTH=403 /DNA_ID=CAMNT_0020373259 /DNA_START=176 /DNA_END=1386 /DNA_ORIENTATION=-
MSSLFAILMLALYFTCKLNSVTAQGDVVVTWERNHPLGGKPYDILQCQTVTVQWTGKGNAEHTLYEFEDEKAYQSCDFSNATLTVEAQVSGTFVVSSEENLTPGKRWFASDQLDDCTNAKMKFSVKVRPPPSLQDKFSGYECEGDFAAGDVVVKNAADIKTCRKFCKRRRGCVSVMYIGGNKLKCRLYRKPPFRAVQKNAQTMCEVAVTSCDPTARSDVQVVAKPQGQDGCVFCNNYLSPDMLENNSVCDSCTSCRPENCEAGNGYCEFTCWATGYDIGKKCCDISVQKRDDSEDCQECTNHRTQWMVENRRLCEDYSFAYTNRCGNEDPLTGSRSWWLDSPVQYCQYSCWKNGAGFQGKTLSGGMIVGDKRARYPQTFDSRPCCPRDDTTDNDLFPISPKRV